MPSGFCGDAWFNDWRKRMIRRGKWVSPKKYREGLASERYDRKAKAAGIVEYVPAEKKKKKRARKPRKSNRFVMAFAPRAVVDDIYDELPF